MSDKTRSAAPIATHAAQQGAPQAELGLESTAPARSIPLAPLAGSAGLAAAVLADGKALAIAGQAAPPQSMAAKAAAKIGLIKLIADVDEGLEQSATALGMVGGDEATSEGGLRVDRVNEPPLSLGVAIRGSAEDGTAAKGLMAGPALGTLDGTAPAAPPSIVLDKPGPTGDATPQISGSTNLTPGALVSVTVTDANGQVQIIHTTVDANGRFAVDTTPLPDGDFEVLVQAQNTTVTTSGIVDTMPPTLRLDPVAITSDNTPAISGLSNLPAGSSVKVNVVDAAGLSQDLIATIGPDGRFSVSPDQHLSDGRYTVQVVAADEAGNIQTNTSIGVVDTKAHGTSGDAMDARREVFGQAPKAWSDAVTDSQADQGVVEIKLSHPSPAGVGQEGEPAAVHISDFNPAMGDALDLRDLLIGEQGVDLSTYLEFDTTSLPGSTVVQVSTTGQFAHGDRAPGVGDQTIVLDGVDLRGAMGLGAHASDSQLIQTLLHQGKLLTDGGV